MDMETMGGALSASILIPNTDLADSFMKIKSGALLGLALADSDALGDRDGLAEGD